MTERDEGDTFETHIGSVSGPVHTGKGDILIENWENWEHWEQRGLTREEVEALRGLFRDLRTQVVEKAPSDELAKEAQEKVDTLEEAVTAAEPDVSAMERVKRWFGEHLPSAAGAVTSLLVNPIVGKMVEAAGDLAADELRRRFGRAKS